MAGLVGHEPDLIGFGMRETIDIAKKYSSLAYQDLSNSAIQKAKECLLDYLGCTFAGFFIESSLLVRNFAKSNYAAGNCTIIGEDAKLNAAGASFINGSTGHGPELDDLHKEGGVHAGVVIIPAALSMAEERHLGGSEFIAATIAGYDVAVKVGRSANPKIQLSKGFHTTSTCGVFGAATAASRLMNFGADKAANALGIAGSFASGSLECYSDGSLTKRINPGIAASSGVIAANLASLGYTGPKSILEGERGFFNAYSGDGYDIGRLVLSDRFEIEDISLKLHATCGFNQAPIDAAMDLCSKYDIHHKDIQHILIELSDLGYFTVGQPKEIKLNPKNGVDAQFSCPYSVAIACIEGKAMLEEYSPSAVRRSDVRRLMDKIETKHSADLDAYGSDVLPARITIRLKNDVAYTKEVIHAKGDKKNPLSWEEIVFKFMSLVPETIFKNSHLERIVDVIFSIEQVKDMNQLTSLLYSS